jgi:hypothetical protein
MNTTVKTVVAFIGWLRQIWMRSFVVKIRTNEKVDIDARS